ncbi:MAG: hypothetical protein ACM3O7_11460 [Acidobacteriota bacterium]
MAGTAAAGEVIAPAAGTIVSPSAGETVQAGQLVDVRWTPLDARVDEFELLLSLDDGDSFPIRLTERLEPGLIDHRWSVPNLPSSSARLRVRFGWGGEEHEAPIGGAFCIAAAAGDPAARLSFHEGEWWTSRVAPVSPPEVEVPERRAESQPRSEWTASLVSLGPRVEPIVAGRWAETSAPVAVADRSRASLGSATTARPLATPQRE